MKNEQQFQPLDQESVRIVAVELMEKNVTTTSSDVKEVLRAMGYWALSVEVENCMRDLCEREGWFSSKQQPHPCIYYIDEDAKYFYRNLSKGEMRRFLRKSLFCEN